MSGGMPRVLSAPALPQYAAAAMAPSGGSLGSCPNPGMMDQCCNMLDQGCCPTQGQQCTTVWERKCTNSYVPQCVARMTNKCEYYSVKSCRPSQEYRSVTFTVPVCKVVTENKCFTYTKKSCDGYTAKHNATFSWTDERIDSTMEDKQMCKTVKTCNIVDDFKTETKKTQKKECNQVPITKQQCTTVQIPSPPQRVPYTDYRTEYKQQCYSVPKPVCKQVPCQYAVQTASICPTCISPGTPGPSCGPSDPCGGGPAPAPAPVDMCGSCRQQNVQMCTRMTQKCETTYEQVCQSVPIRIPVQKWREVPQPPRSSVQCNPVTTTVEQCRMIWVDEPVRVPIKRCESGSENKCLSYTVPVTNVIRDNKDGWREYDVPTCRIKDVPNAQHCAQLPVKEICQDQTVTRRVKIATTKCDRQSSQQKCLPFPEHSCTGYGGQQCQMVPREVCQPSCPQTDYCNQCTQFAAGGGFGQCGTPTCPNYVS